MPWLILLSSALFFLLGCGKPPTPAELISASHKEVTPYKNRVDFSLQDFVGQYLSIGSHDPKWDAAATNGLAAMAKSRVALSTVENRALGSTARREIQAAMDAGCNDALVNYTWTWLRYPDATSVDQAGKDAWVQAYAMLHNSQYSPLRRCWATIKAAQAAKAIAKDTPREVHDYRQEAADLALVVLADTSIPPEEALQLTWNMLDAVRQNKGELKFYFDQVDPLLKKNWNRFAEAWFIRGDFEVNLAWAARGTGYADSVSKAGWKEFASHLAIAEKSLLKSWKMQPMEKTANRLITVELGQGNGREKMEKYFNWAMTLNPNSSEACRNKLNYLFPKWYGTPETLMQFGWECISSTNWAGEVPLTMIFAHDELAAEYYPKREERDAYWQDPAVWPGIDAAFTKYFKLYPNDVGWHHNYFWYAVKCHQWPAAERELALLGPINYSYFGGREAFESMVSETKKHSLRSPASAQTQSAP